MATTQTVLGIDQVKGPAPSGALHAYRVAVQLSGTYLTGSKPNFDILAALQACHEGVTAVAVKACTLLNDFNDGSNVYTAPNTQIALSSTGNKVATFRVDSGATLGDATGTEVADGTALNGIIMFLVTCAVTGA